LQVEGCATLYQSFWSLISRLISTTYKFNNSARHKSAIGEQLSMFRAKFILRMRSNCYLWASGQNYDTQI